MGELVRSDFSTRQRRGGEPDHSHQLLRLRSRDVQLWRSGSHSQDRPRTVSALATVLLLHPGGVLTMRTRHFAIAAGLLALAAFDFDITNDNQPTLDDLVKNPTRAKLSATATALFAGARSGIQALIWRLGSMGREGINLSGNNQPDFIEPYFGPVVAGGSFGGTLWIDRYAHIRTAHIFLQALASNGTASLPATERLTASEVAGARGVANTLKALALLYVVETRDSLGAPVDVDRPVDAPPAPFVRQDSVYAYIIGVLNSAATDLAAGGSSFFFHVPPGLSAFATPATFLKFNRALAAKANVLRATAGCAGNSAACYGAAITALGASRSEERRVGKDCRVR